MRGPTARLAVHLHSVRSNSNTPQATVQEEAHLNLAAIAIHAFGHLLDEPCGSGRVA